MRLYDAHNHLQDYRLDVCRAGIPPELARLGVCRAVVNGTREEDWAAVAMLAAEHRWVLPSFGLHPWHVKERSDRWYETLVEKLEAHPAAMVGEIGLDRWIQGYDLDQQTEVFATQLRLASQRNLPATIHCLKAWGALWEIIRTHPLPACGFLLHAYGGPAEMVDGLVKHGAYFSFSTYFLHPRKSAQRDVFKNIPLERLLVETDAPDMAPPPERSRHILNDPISGKPLNHPANLFSAYEELAQIRDIEVRALADQVERNFGRLFG